ncbi:MAG TPA: DUF5925 domain-containing protein [Actinomycetota bacterium]|nr:DUF5925 domain-containing protein [Actinomycetota bacterium]
MRGPIHTVQHVHTTDPADLAWVPEVADRGLTVVLFEDWVLAANGLRLTGLPRGFRILREVAGDGSHSFLAEVGASLAYVSAERGTLRAKVAGPTRKTAEDSLLVLRTVFPAAAPDETGRRLPVRFWHFDDVIGGDSTVREIEVPSWDEIAANYAAPTREALESLMGSFEPGAGGRLLLWHGPPGTGKTYALRALAWQWRSWAELHYVVDPETLLGREPGYLVDVALPEGHRPARTPEWRLLVLEDVGEMLGVDARLQVGQALSRLLNLVDGLLGQGLPLVLLATTNEPLGQLHPALARAGRSAAVVEFAALSAEEARAWLRERGAPDAAERITGPATIAELHALLEGRPASGPRRPFGFGAG